MKKTNRIKTKILAAALSATMVFSFGAMTATTASAATNWNAYGDSFAAQRELEYRSLQKTIDKTKT